MPARINHNSKVFYDNSGLYTKETSEEKLGRRIVNAERNVIEPEQLNKIHPCDCRYMNGHYPNESVDLIVTSPPYNVGKEYDDGLTLPQYIDFLSDVFFHCHRILITGGRICINVANLGRKPYIPVHSYIITAMEQIGFLMRGEIIWNKGPSAGVSCAWGSYKSASNPVLRDTHEYILVFSKGSFTKAKTGKSENTITKEQFLEWTKSVWDFPAARAKKIGHPAPFPIELPYRLIQMYTFKNDIVLDPFMGSGQTALAAIQSFRNYIGYDTNKEYVMLANERIVQYGN